MFNSTNLLPIALNLLAACVLAIGALGSARAEGYAFNRFLSGGGGGTDPTKQRIATQMGAYICVNVSPGGGPAGSTVNFLLWSSIPQMNSRVVGIYLDTGRHIDLFNNVNVLTQPHGLKATAVRPSAHAFLPGLTPDFGVSFSYLAGPAVGKLAPGLAPGQSILISANLGAGKSLSDVVKALNEGFNPPTAASGLRIGVIVQNLLGGPPKGVGTISDDGGFVASVASERCQRR